MKNKTDKKIEEQYKKVEDIKLPHRWKYNSEYMRMENIADVHDENEEFMGTCPIALVPHDIKQFIYDNYTPNTEVQKAREEAVRKFKELRNYIDKGWIDGGEYGMSPRKVDELFNELEVILTQQSLDKDELQETRKATQ